MALNEFQKEEARRLFAEGKTTMDVYRHLGAKSAGFKSPIEYSTPASVLSAPTLGQQNRTQFVQTVADMPQDVFSGVKGLGEGYLDRFQRLQDTAGAALRGEQSFGETATQLSANIAGGAIADPAFTLLKTGGSLLTTPEQERRIGEGFNQAVTAVGEKTSITDWYTSQSPRTQRNIDAALDIVDVAPVSIAGKFKSLFSPKAAPEVKLAEVIEKAETGDVTDGVRVATAALDDTVRQTEVDNLAKAYQDSLVGDRVKVNRLLQEQAADMSRGGVVMTQDDLVKALANEGIIPDIRGKLADFTTEIRNLDARQNELFKAYQPVLESSKATASIDDFASFTARSMAESPNLRFELDKAEGQLNTILQNLRRSYGLDENGTLTAKQIDDISRQANARTKAYRETDTFQADVYSELGRAARKWLNENIPDESFRKVNEEWLRLEQVKRTAEAMQNQQVDVGILGRALGSYVTTLSGVTLGASVANPAVAVAAGILTKLGGDAYADALRSKTFSPEIRAKLQERLANDKALIEKLKETSTTQENKNLFDQVSRMLPAPREGALRSEVTGGAPMRVAPQGETTNLSGDMLETARPGAINAPKGEGRPLPRALYPQLSEADLQKLKTDSFRKLLAKAGVDVEDISKAIAGGTIGIVLATYLNEDGSMLPAFGAVLAVASSRAGKLRMLDEAIDANLKRRDAYSAAGKDANSREMRIIDTQYASLVKERNKIRDGLSPGLGTRDVSRDFSPDADLRTNREVIAKDVTGAKVTIPANTVLNPKLTDKGNAVITLGGKSYTLPKSQYENLKGQSTRAIASEFAPELKGTVETVKGNAIKNKEITDYNIIEAGTGRVHTYASMDFAKKAVAEKYPGAKIEVKKYKKDVLSAEDKTKYSQYTLDGGENYREILIQAPEKRTTRKLATEQDVKASIDKVGFYRDGDVLIEPDRAGGFNLKIGEEGPTYWDSIKEALEDAGEANGKVVEEGNYKSSHWSEPNVISHLRMNERTVDGKKYAFMEELQSDWAREGRDKGFIDEAATKFTSLPTGYVVKTRKIPEGVGVINGGKDRYWVESPNGERVSGVANNGEHWDKQDAINTALRGFNKYGAVPNNPLLKDWQIPTTKRALIEAVDSGADRFAWINGEQTSARYNLATHVEKVNWYDPTTSQMGVNGTTIELTPKAGGKRLEFAVKEDGTIYSVEDGTPTDWKGKKLDEVLGKGLADKIMADKKGTLSGEGLSFGGEWAKNLYDRQVRDIVKKLTGAEVKTVDMGLGDTTVTLRKGLQNWRAYKGNTDILIYESPESAAIVEKKAKAMLAQTQQYIDLTPEVKARIRSEAPKFSMKADTNVAMPLLLAYFYAGEEK